VAQYNTTHEAVEIKEEDAASSKEDLPEGPCGTDPVRV
jgi:hypothetical protein